jgi:hypothetical protein
MKKLVILSLILIVCNSPGKTQALSQVSQLFNKYVSEMSGNQIPEDSVNNFVQNAGPNSYHFLIQQAKSYPEIKGRKFAILALGRIGGNIVADSLVALSQQLSPLLCTSAVFAIQKTGVTDIKERLETIVTMKGSPHARIAAATCLRWLGDERSIVILQALRAGVLPPNIVNYIEKAESAIKFRLSGLPGFITVDQWQLYDRRFWTVALEPNLNRSIYYAIKEKAQQLISQEKLPLVYLERIIDEELPESSDMAICLVGLQKESTAVPKLEQYALNTGSRGIIAVQALVNIKSKSAVQSLGKLLSNKQFLWKSRAVDGLVFIGTPEAATVLEKLALVEPQKEIASDYLKKAKLIRNKSNRTDDRKNQ